jgi:hypothetical protein
MSEAAKANTVSFHKKAVRPSTASAWPFGVGDHGELIAAKRFQI